MYKTINWNKSKLLINYWFEIRRKGSNSVLHKQFLSVLVLIPPTKFPYRKRLSIYYCQSSSNLYLTSVAHLPLPRWPRQLSRHQSGQGQYLRHSVERRLYRILHRLRIGYCSQQQASPSVSFYIWPFYSWTIPIDLFDMRIGLYIGRYMYNTI